MKIFSLIGFTILFVWSLAYADEQKPDCSSSHMAQMQCEAAEYKKLDIELNRVYQLALAARPENDETDNRKNREQLRKSQRAWLIYKDEQCTLEGGLEGGSNSWVTTFATECAKKELKKRIKFLQAVADDQFGDH